MEEFIIYHQKGTPYHPQDNGIGKEFNKILKTTLTKICNIQCDDWDYIIPTTLWSYQTTSKRLTGQMPFRLVFGKEVIMPMEFIVPSLRVVSIMNLTKENAL